MIAQHTGWLYTRIHENHFFFLDYWTLVHLWAGLILYAVLKVIVARRTWLWFTISIVVFEFLKIGSFLLFMRLFITGNAKDWVVDLSATLCGGFLCGLFLRDLSLKSSSRRYRFDLALFISITLAFFWTGFYHYQYNKSGFNTPGINIWAFSLWSLFGLLLCMIYQALRTNMQSPALRIILLWFIYFGSLLIIEFIGYYLLKIHENSDPRNPPLVFGMIHGNVAMHIYYLLYPLIVIGFFETAWRISASASTLARVEDTDENPVYSEAEK